MRDLTFYLTNTPPLPVPHLNVDITLYYRPIEAADLPSQLVQKLDDQDRLTEVGHSVAAAFSKHFAGLSFQCAVADWPPLADTLAIDGEFLSCSVDAGSVLALPRGSWTWQCGSFDEDHFGRMAIDWGPIREIEIPVQELWLKT